MKKNIVEGRLRCPKCDSIDRFEVVVPVVCDLVRYRDGLYVIEKEFPRVVQLGDAVKCMDCKHTTTVKELTFAAAPQNRKENWKP